VFKTKTVRHDSDDIESEDSISMGFLNDDLRKLAQSLEPYPTLDLIYDIADEDTYTCYGTIMIDIPEEIDRQFIKKIKCDFNGSAEDFLRFMDGEDIEDLELDTFAQTLLRGFLVSVLKSVDLLRLVGLDGAAITEIGVYNDNIVIRLGDNNQIWDEIDIAEDICSKLRLLYRMGDNIQKAMISTVNEIQSSAKSDNIMSQFQTGCFKLNKFAYVKKNLFEGTEFVMTLPNDILINQLPTTGYFAHAVTMIFNRFLSLNEPDTKIQQLTFKNFTESFKLMKESITLRSEDTVINCYIEFERKYTSSRNLFCVVSFNSVEITETFLKFIKYFDGIFEDFVKTHVRLAVYNQLRDNDLNAIQKAEKQYLNKVIQR